MAGISVETKYFASSGASSPALALQMTCLVDSYMLWIGVTEELEENASRAILQGHLGKDWAVSMPPWKVRNSRNEGIGWLQQGNSFSPLHHQTLPATGSQLLRSSSSDVALSISKRLGEQLIVGDRRYLMRATNLRTARRFGKQIFLCVDIPVSMGDDSGIVERVERALVDTLKEMEKK
jgi:proteasome assembly chaperone 4